MSTTWMAGAVRIGRCDPVEIRVEVVTDNPNELAGAVHHHIEKHHLLASRHYEVTVELLANDPDRCVVTVETGARIVADFTMVRVLRSVETTS